ncbi:hypothetical protein [Erysipelothrix anatis]|uniref:hypothetical protein n=1 Tax=Erysipelothrix anatis TaxID=2683713 RepID=UPI00135B22E6|nr:hypothetical protein [Erysipelothrix anatis]
MKTTKNITLSAILIAMGIAIPTFMPKFILPPASYTLASHVPIFIAMFISPVTAVSVALGTAFGFLMTTTPEIAARALSHVIFATIGALYLQKHPALIKSKKQLLIFNIIIAIIHASSEVLVVTPFYFTKTLAQNSSYIVNIILLVGIGGFIHSMIDFFIAQTVFGKVKTVIR